MVDIKRETAKKCRVKDIVNGRYIKREGWEPNYLETNLGRISRANILGIIIGEDEGIFTVDDGTGQIEIRSFDEQKKYSDKKVGDIVVVIGRPRVFNDKKYIVPEIIKKIDNSIWIKYRKLELNGIKSTPQREEKTILNKEQSTGVDIVDSLLQKISELDQGYGVKVDELTKIFEPATASRTINRLIEQGEIFEIKPGIVKTI
ncbi:hypothetical protein ACFLTH_14140 [Bacteroidota bacterium]